MTRRRWAFWEWSPAGFYRGRRRGTARIRRRAWWRWLRLLRARPGVPKGRR